MDDKILLLANYIQEAKNISILSGAGISTESGIPDFRSSTGLWNDVLMYGKSRTQLMSLNYFNNNREKFWPIYKDIFKIKLSMDFKPNYGHEFLAQLEKQNKNVEIFTQNVDGLHQAAGSSKVFEVHGTIQKSHCTNCGEEYSLEYVNSQEVPRCNHLVERNNVCNNYIPLIGVAANYVDCDECGTRHDITNEKNAVRCKGKKKRVHSCKGILKPDVVLFGDSIRYYSEAKKSAMYSDLFIVVGTSLQVGPINEIPIFASSMSKCKMVLITKDKTELDSYFDIVINDSIGDTFRKINKILEK